MNTSADASPAASFFAIILISSVVPSFSRFVRKYSRSNRLIRFLVTAFPTRLVTVTPSRDCGVDPVKNKTIKCEFCTRRPVLEMLMNSGRFRIRSAPVYIRLFNSHPLGYQQALLFPLNTLKSRFVFLSANAVRACPGRRTYTDSRFLPFCLLRLMIFLPCFVDILIKNPCRLARWGRSWYNLLNSVHVWGFIIRVLALARLCGEVLAQGVAPWAYFPICCDTRGKWVMGQWWAWCSVALLRSLPHHCQIRRIQWKRLGFRQF